ncbi:hypothetical protein I4U23_011896 [Adineta vaga]|nr:hypothetical protein I4U23_011896 [Adineta vaga]
MPWHILLILSLSTMMISLSPTNESILPTKASNSFHFIPNKYSETASLEDSEIHITINNVILIFILIILLLLILFCFYYQQLFIDFISKLYTRTKNENERINEETTILNAIPTLSRPSTNYLTVPESFPHSS